MRIYVCDRCLSKSPKWNTTQVEIPAGSIFGNPIRAELCDACIEKFGSVYKEFMKNKETV